MVFSVFPTIGGARGLRDPIGGGDRPLSSYSAKYTWGPGGRSMTRLDLIHLPHPGARALIALIALGFCGILEDGY